MAALTVTTKCNKDSRDALDIVCLRLLSYMNPNDPILFENNGAVKDQLDLVRSAQHVKRTAGDTAKLEALWGHDDLMYDDFHTALSKINAGNGPVHSMQEHAVMNFFRDKGLFDKDTEKQWQVLAMIQRGLIMHDVEKCLTCSCGKHRGKQLWGFQACVEHFTTVKTWHQSEKPVLEDLARILKTRHHDETCDGMTVLERYFGCTVVKMMQKMNWHKGDKLGKPEPKPKGKPRPDSRPTFSRLTHPEMFDTFAHTLGQSLDMKGEERELQSRLKRDRTGNKIAEVPFCLKEIAESSFPALTWHEIARALVSMTEFAFSKTGHVHVYDDKLDMQALDDTGQERFFWTLTHVKLSMLKCLPQELQAGMDIAGNGPLWRETMQNLMQYSVYDWSLVRWKQDLGRLVGRLWKTLEVAMNGCDLDLAFCTFFCAQVMEGLRAVEDSFMTFLPTLEAFAPVPEAASASLRGGPAAVSTPAKTRVRYRAQGLADNRYGKKATHKQLRTSTLARPFQAAHGVPPERRRR